MFGPSPGSRNPSPARALIITVESGVVTDILPTGPVEAVIVDLDMLENDDTFEQRMRKSVLPLIPEDRITSHDVSKLVTTIVQEYRRPARKRPVPSPDGKQAA
jgi:hypothetical protein